MLINGLFSQQQPSTGKELKAKKTWCNIIKDSRRLGIQIEAEKRGSFGWQNKWVKYKERRIPRETQMKSDSD